MGRGLTVSGADSTLANSMSQTVSGEHRILQKLKKNQRNHAKHLKKENDCDGFVGLETHFLESL